MHARRPLLDEASLPGVTACGINFPSPDMMTPQRSAAAIWTWAPAHPFAPFSERALLLKETTSRHVAVPTISCPRGTMVQEVARRSALSEELSRRSVLQTWNA